MLLRLAAGDHGCAPLARAGIPARNGKSNSAGDATAGTVTSRRGAVRCNAMRCRWCAGAVYIHRTLWDGVEAEWRQLATGGAAHYNKAERASSTYSESSERQD